jgi:hypothetical protein
LATRFRPDVILIDATPPPDPRAIGFLILAHFSIPVDTPRKRCRVRVSGYSRSRDALRIAGAGPTQAMQTKGDGSPEGRLSARHSQNRARTVARADDYEDPLNATDTRRLAAVFATAALAVPVALADSPHFIRASADLNNDGALSESWKEARLGDNHRRRADITCPPGQRLELAQATYTNAAISDTTNEVTESIPGTFDTGCLLPNARGR